MTAPTTTRATRWQNFDAIRLVAATLVVLSHSFLLSGTGYGLEPLVRLFGYHRDLGILAVGAFFVISGFLITSSYVHRASALSFLVNRVLRIFPGLIVCTIVSALLIGPWFARDGIAFVTAPETWEFISRTAFLQREGGQHFPAELYAGMQGHALLGTTWTLAAEFQCYVLVLLLGLLGALRLPVAVALVAVGMWVFGQQEDAIMLEALTATGVFFAAGMTLYFVHARWRPTHAIVGLAAVGLVASAVAGRPMEGFALFGSVLLIQLATTDRVRLPDLARHGDLSYGVYLYGFPAQQIVRAAWGSSITWWQLFALAMPLALGAAWLSWHFVESRALALARRYRDSIVDDTQRAPVGPSDALPATSVS